MKRFEIIRKKMEETLAEKFSQFQEISHFIYEHPEMGGKEFTSSAYLAKYLEKEGFHVTFPYAHLTKESLDQAGVPEGENLETSFLAERGTDDADVTIAFLAEYDALPGFTEDGGAGHACGHNWIAATMVGCGVVLAEAIDELNKSSDGPKYKVKVIGTSAEETFGAKVNMANLGAFDDVDLVFQAHLSDKFSMEVPTLAMYSIAFDYHGKAAHAAINPEKGINALDSVISLFNHANAYRQFAGKDAIIHGIITHGGTTSNVIPDYAQCQFEIRERTRGKLDQLRGRMMEMAKASALAHGTTMEYRDYENNNDELINLKSLTSVCYKHFEEKGISDFVPEKEYVGAGSTDLGNVSYMCPTVYAEVMPLDENGQTIPVNVHDKGALEIVDSDAAHRIMRVVIESYTATAVEILLTPGKVEEIHKEWEEERTKRLQ